MNVADCVFLAVCLALLVYLVVVILRAGRSL